MKLKSLTDKEIQEAFGNVSNIERDEHNNLKRLNFITAIGNVSIILDGWNLYVKGPVPPIKVEKFKVSILRGDGFSKVVTVDNVEGVEKIKMEASNDIQVTEVAVEKVVETLTD